jgi:hypothetical protein
VILGTWLVRMSAGAGGFSGTESEGTKVWLSVCLQQAESDEK